MKSVIESKIHNRFDIEVRDAKTEEIKQKGQAENIILDRMYERLCYFNSYFTYIHFGSGTGEPLSTRNTLFDKLGCKSATTEEIIKAFPVSKWTRKITLDPEEYVGKSITEVGISDSLDYINTHALIKDAEGNPLSIEKTDTDVVIIYATVFIELQNRSENIRFINLPNDNSLLNYLLGGSAPDIYIQVGRRWKKEYLHDVISQKTATKEVDIPNKKVVFTTRYGVDKGNGQISSIGLRNIFQALLPADGVFTQHNILDDFVGTGDGINTGFNTTWDFFLENSLKVYVDGVLKVKDRDYQVASHVSKGKNVIRFIESTENNIEGYTYGTNTPEDIFYLCDSSLSYRRPAHWWVTAELPQPVFIDKVKIYRDTAGATDMTKFAVEGFDESIDDWVEIFTSPNVPTTTGWYEYNLESEVIYKQYRVRVVSYKGSPSGTQRFYIELLSSKNNIEFNTPPPEGAIITADYSVPYIPKSEDYVLDVTAEIQFAEGV